MSFDSMLRDPWALVKCKLNALLLFVKGMVAAFCLKMVTFLWSLVEIQIVAASQEISLSSGNALVFVESIAEAQSGLMTLPRLIFS